MRYLILILYISSAWAVELADDFVRQDLKSRQDRYLEKMQQEPEQIERYGRQLYYLLNLEKMAEEKGIANSQPVLEALRIAKAKAYLDLLIDQAMAKAQPDVLELAQERYEANKHKFRSPKRVRLAMIFISKRRWDEENKAKQLIEKIKAEIDKDPSVFHEMAKKYSEDKYAELGGVSRQWILIPPELNNQAKVVRAADALKELGEISPIIEDSRGYTILKLMALDPSQQVPFSAVKEELMQLINDELRKLKKAEIVKQLLPDDEWEPDEDRLLELIKAEAERRQAIPKAATPVPADKPQG